MNTHKPESKNIVDALHTGDAFASIFCIGSLYDLRADKINKLANDFALEICCVNGALLQDDSIYKMYRALLFD